MRDFSQTFLLLTTNYKMTPPSYPNSQQKLSVCVLEQEYPPLLPSHNHDADSFQTNETDMVEFLNQLMRLGNGIQSS
uniref:Meiotic checkpoint regulator cut4, putative n=1 Tax=Arundo donax TaxID=35708 RepID=A0A0A9CJ36_ARUDO